MIENRIPTVAIVGRTNVGKSSLFNALAARTLSLVKDFPGVTRDRNYVLTHRFGFPCTLVDTGGLVGEETGPLSQAVRAQCQLAIAEADLLICVFDGLNGVHALDAEVVDLLRRSKKPVIWVANKCEKSDADQTAGDLYSLGIDNLIRVSAAHKHGLKELITEIKEKLGDLAQTTPIIERSEFDETPVNKPERPADPAIRIAIIGRPNTGKSSIVNKILREERLIASDIAGTTRDSIDTRINFDSQDYVLVDTAGLRRKARIEDSSIEDMSNMRTLRALARCHVAALVIDAEEGGPTEQDSKIAGLVHERGRGLIIVVNKWDKVEKDHRTVKEFEHVVYGELKFAAYAPILFVSAKTGRRCQSILETAKQIYESSRSRIKTSDLNRVLTRAFQKTPPPVYHGEPIKLYFATQTGCEPPTFVLFVNHPKRLNFSYQRYIKNELREAFNFPGVDIKLILRKRISKEERSESELAELQGD